ncbi:YdeI/OmpD-associated family protein [Agromyces sp. ZXT2-3]|uniref:YdeI/OmpD-associated family protein n=1 Tax=Agromyces sp. ZXT2-3 TaxID=3461152 RepID=UPI004054EA32
MQFETTMFQSGNNTGIEVPAEVVEALGGGRRAPVVVRVNGYEYRSTLAVMGGRHLIPFSSDKRAATGISGGDAISVELELDTAPRTVEPPEDFAAALDATPGARAAFDRLAPSHQKAHVTAITEAKTPETRARRIAKAVEKLVGG